MEKKLKKSGRLALGGIITSLCTVFNILAVVVPASGYVLPAIAGMLILIMIFESDYRQGIMVYFSSSFLSLLLCADKFPAFAFMFLLGFYPIIKLKIDRIHNINRFSKLIIKILVFNISIITNFWVEVKLFNVPEESFYVFDIYIPQILLIIANIIFFMYEKCIDNFILLYVNVLQEKLRKVMKN